MDLSSSNLDPAWVYYPSAVLLVVLCIAAWLTSLLTLPGNWIVLAEATRSARRVPANSRIDSETSTT